MSTACCTLQSIARPLPMISRSLCQGCLLWMPEIFQAFSKAGRALANLHLNYEEQPPCPDVLVEGVESGNFRVEKMRFLSKGDKSAIQYNESIRLSNIPLDAYEYVVNGRSAIEWIMDRYQIRVDKASGIVNDPNDWAAEHNKPRYILDLLLSIVTVSLETNRIRRRIANVDVSCWRKKMTQEEKFGIVLKNTRPNILQFA